MPGRLRHFRAFTLIELLVVLAIIGVLVACLQPGLNAVRQLSLRTQCTSRLHHLNAALLLYVADNETFPAQSTPNYHNTEGIWFGYASLLLPYLGLTSDEAHASPAIFTCPLEHNDVDHPSYLFNAANQYDPSYPGLAGRPLARVVHPARTLLIYELCAIYPTSWHEPRPGQTSSFKDAKSIASFVDGHVAWIPFYWSGGALSVTADPPPNYDYQWSSN